MKTLNFKPEVIFFGHSGIIWNTVIKEMVEVRAIAKKFLNKTHEERDGYSSRDSFENFGKRRDCLLKFCEDSCGNFLLCPKYEDVDMEDFVELADEALQRLSLFCNSKEKSKQGTLK